MKFVVCFLVFSIMLSSCAKKNNEYIQSESIYYIFDLDKTPIEDTILLSSFVNSIIPIPLETKEDNLMGFVSSLQTTDLYIFVSDNSASNGLFMFAKDGTFIKKIGRFGQGPGEYLAIHDFTIDEVCHWVYVLDYEANKVLVYDFLTGNFIRDISVRHEQYMYDYIQLADSMLWGNVNQYTLQQKGEMLQTLDLESGKVQNKYLDLETHNLGWRKSFYREGGFFFNRVNGEPKYCNYFMDTIMVIRQHTIVPYAVVKSKDWIKWEDKVEDNSPILDMKNDLLLQAEKKNVAFNIQNYAETERYIYFTYKKQGKDMYVIYDKRMDKLRQTYCLANDLLYNSPYANIDLIGCEDKDGMYGYIGPQSTPAYYEYAINDSINSLMKPEFRHLLKRKVVEESNPIVFYYECKK